MTMDISLVLLFPTITCPTNNAIPLSPGVLYRFKVAIADSMASETCFLVNLDLIFAA